MTKSQKKWSIRLSVTFVALLLLLRNSLGEYIPTSATQSSVIWNHGWPLTYGAMYMHYENTSNEPSQIRTMSIPWYVTQSSWPSTYVWECILCNAIVGAGTITLVIVAVAARDLPVWQLRSSTLLLAPFWILSFLSSTRFHSSHFLQLLTWCIYLSIALATLEIYRQRHKIHRLDSQCEANQPLP
jgi:hypothetical protein